MHPLDISLDGSLSQAEFSAATRRMCAPISFSMCLIRASGEWPHFHDQKHYWPRNDVLADLGRAKERHAVRISLWLVSKILPGTSHRQKSRKIVGKKNRAQIFRYWRKRMKS